MKVIKAIKPHCLSANIAQPTRSDILQGQALFRGVKQLLTRAVWLCFTIFGKLSFPFIEKMMDKRQTGKKDKPTKKKIDRQTKRQWDKKQKEKRQTD